jgi:hypothetical protein
MDGWDVALLAVAGYVAVSALVRLMLARRDRLLAEFRAQMAEEKRRRKQAPKKPAARDKAA